MLPPLPITRRLVMNPCKKLKLLQRHLLWWNPQLLLQLALRRALHAQNSRVQLRTCLPGDAQRMRAASVCPHVGEGDFLGSALLQEETLVGVEEEDGEGTVEEAAVDVFHYVACLVSQCSMFFVEGIGGRTSFLAGTSNRLIIVIQNDTHLIHQPHLLLIIPLKFIALARNRRRSSRENRASERSVHVREDGRHVLCRDLRHGLGSTHFRFY